MALVRETATVLLEVFIYFTFIARLLFGVSAGISFTI